jgi:hypothetical protein
MAWLNGYAERFPEIAALGTGAWASYESAQLLEGAVHRLRYLKQRILLENRGLLRETEGGRAWAKTRKGYARGSKRWELSRTAAGAVMLPSPTKSRNCSA